MSCLRHPADAHLRLGRQYQQALAARRSPVRGRGRSRGGGSGLRGRRVQGRVLAGGGKLEAVDFQRWKEPNQRDEHLKWSRDHAHPYSMAAAANAVLIGGPKGVTAVAKSDGKQIWRHEVDGPAGGMALPPVAV